MAVDILRYNSVARNNQSDQNLEVKASQPSLSADHAVAEFDLMPNAHRFTMTNRDFQGFAVVSVCEAIESFGESYLDMTSSKQ